MSDIINNKTKSRMLYVGFIALVVVAILIYQWQKSTTSSHIRYQEIVVKRGDIRTNVLATGTVEPENRLEIKPPIAGRVESILVKEGQRVVKGQILAWMSSTERAALLDAARTHGSAEVERWERLYRPTPVVAPIDGTIILKAIEAGQTFVSSDAILVMSDHLIVQAQVDETDIAQIKLKQNAEISLDAYANQPIPAVVEHLAYEAKTINNVTTYEVDVLPNKVPDYMRSGMTANVVFFISEKKDVLIVPTESIKLQDNKSFVLIPSKNGSMLEQEVEIGISDGKSTEIISGLKEGDTIYTAQIAQPGVNNAFSPLSPMQRRTKSK